MWRPVSEDELHRFVDDQLERGRVSSVEAYLEANPEEAARIEDYCRINDWLKALADGFDRELPREGEARLSAFVRKRLLRRRRLVLGTAAASALIIAAGLGASADAILRAPAAPRIATPAQASLEAAGATAHATLASDPSR
jgi:anti-sigma factor RsiW